MTNDDQRRVIPDGPPLEFGVDWGTEQHPPQPDTSPAALKARAARVISRALSSGDLRHPNNPQGVLLLAGQHPDHPNPEVRDATEALNTMISEALIDTVLTELGAQLVTDVDLQALTTTAVNNPSRVVTLQCDHGELLQVTVQPSTDVARIACGRLRANLSECETH